MPADPGKGYGRRRLFINVAGLAAVLCATAGAARGDAPTRLLVLGDSLAAGFGLPREQAFPARLQAKLRAAGLAVEVIDAGVSGDTSAGGLARLDWALAAKPDAVIVELGGNDGLRGLDPQATHANLDAILARLEARKLKVLLAGMLAPPNLGRDYGAEFTAVYRRLAEQRGVMLYPFFLDGVAAQPALNQADGIHPNVLGVEVIVDRILPYVRKLIAG